MHLVGVVERQLIWADDHHIDCRRTGAFFESDVARRFVQVSMFGGALGTLCVREHLTKRGLPHVEECITPQMVGRQPSWRCQ